MGLVKWNKTTLNIENVPDGHEIVSEADLNRLRQASDAFSVLKSKIPAGVGEDQLGVLIEKGQRHDTIAQESDSHKKNASELSKKLEKFANIPPDFSLDQWQKDRNTEKANIRAGKLAKLKEQVFAKAEEKYKTKFDVDDRFVEDLSAFDLDAKDAVDKLYEVYDRAHTAQRELVNNIIKKSFPSPDSVGGQKKLIGGVESTGPADIITEGATTLKRI